MRPLVRLACSTVVVAAALLVPARVSHAGDPADDPSPTSVEISTRINGVPVRNASANLPMRLEPDRPTFVLLALHNTGDAPVTAQFFRLEGDVVELAVLTHETDIGVELEPGQRENIEFPVEFFDLGGQAAGLVAARAVVLDADRRPVASQSFTADVRGRVATSSQGLLASAILVFAVLAVLFNLWAVFTGTLASSRLIRALRFGVTGAAVGLALSLSLATFRIVGPSSGVWVSITVVGALLGALLGIASPGREAIDTDDQPPDRYDEDRLRETVL